MLFSKRTEGFKRWERAVITGVYCIFMMLNCKDLWDFVLQLCLTLEFLHANLT